MVGVYGNAQTGAVAARRTGLGFLVALTLALLAVPASADDLFAVGNERLNVRMHPDVVRPNEIGVDGISEVGLESMLRARAVTAGPDLSVEIGHRSAATPDDDAFDLQQQLGVHGRLVDVISLPAYGIGADLGLGYSVADPAALSTGTMETTLTLRSSPFDRLSTQTDVTWHGRRPEDDERWHYGGSGRLGLNYALPGFGTLGAFERLEIADLRGQEYAYETGVSLDFGAHTFSLSQRLEYVDQRLVGPPAAAAEYGWQVGSIDMALSADYTAATDSAPAAGFAGLAVTFGLAGPGPSVLLDMLR
ncbi:hypothetical protein [Rhodovibrio salinarum]|uniref:MetA-pathway of phenol degradation n=1 Tax=Rhodovibrio salinarum TaxID=1087 RepID=A0A934QKX1_9PROT|nr:hypothetical protein [Rhodovibrio salinarum]MBK1698808.1 hypothetical protein [Rhodovibrio salinarum]